MAEVMTLIQAWIANIGVDTLFLTVFILGIVATLPIGPLSVVALDQSHKYGRNHGLAMATCAILGDMVGIGITLFFYKSIQWLTEEYQLFIYTFLSILMLLFGFVFLFKKKRAESLKKKVIHWLNKFKVKKELSEKLYQSLSRSHKFTYLFSFLWSAFHIGNLITYGTISLIITAMGNNLSENSTLAEYLLALFLGTAVMWYGWILLGELKFMKKLTFWLVKTFGFVFVVAGILTFTFKAAPYLAS